LPGDFQRTPGHEPVGEIMAVEPGENQVLIKIRASGM